MTQESRLVQNIAIKADGASLLKPIEQIANEISRTATQIGRVFEGNTRLTKAQKSELEGMVRRMGQLTSQAGSLEKILNGLQTKKQNRSLTGLDDQSLGRQAQSAAALRKNLQATTEASSALEIRLNQLRQRFADLAKAGRQVGQRELSKALGTEKAIADLRQLESQLQRIDRKAALSGSPLSANANTLRSQITTSQAELLALIKNPRRINFGSEVSSLNLLIGQYEKLAVAEAKAGVAANRAREAARQSLMAQSREADEMLRARLQRGASRYSFTSDDVRSRNLTSVGLEAEQTRLFARAQQIRSLIVKATAEGSGASQQYLNGLNKAWEAITGRISQAIALQRAYNNLPETRAATTRKAVTDALFGDGGFALGSRVLAVQGIFAVINAVRDGARFVVQFEDALAQLQAVAGATDTEMTKLAGSIQETARTTKFSAVEITKSATTIAQAGYSAAETGSILRDALNLATASGTSPADAVDTLTSTLGAFQLQAGESAHVVDVLVEALNRSKLSITQMQSAIQYAGATAKENGIQFEELAAIAGSLANAGIRSGSTIGTGIRQLLVDLKTPTEDFKQSLADVGLTMADVDVKANGLAGVVKKLTQAGFSAQQAYDSFEVRAASAFLAFRNQIGTYDQLALALATAGSATEAQAKAMDSLSAKGQRLLNVLGELVVTLSGPFVDLLKLVADGLSEIVMGVTNFIKNVAGLTGSLGLSSGALAGFNALLSGALVALAGFAVGGPIGAAIAGVAGFAASLKYSTTEMDRLKAASNEADAALDSQTQTIATADEAIQNLIDREVTLRNNKVALQAETVNLTNKFGELSTILQGQVNDYDQLLAAMIRYRTEAAKKGEEDARAKGIALRAERQGYLGQLGQPTGDLQFDLRAQSRITRGGKVPEALAYFQKNLGTDFSKLDTAGLSSASIGFLGQLNTLRSANIDGKDKSLASLISSLEKRYDVLQKLVTTQSNIDLTDQQQGLFRVQGSRQAQTTQTALTKVTGAVNSALTQNARAPGSAEDRLTRLTAEIENGISNFEREISRLDKTSPEAAVFGANLQALQEQLGRITSARRKTEEDGAKELRGLSGGKAYTSREVGLLLQKDFGTTTTSAQRSLQRQGELYAAAGGKGVAKPNANAPHVADKAVDIAPPGNNITPEDITNYLTKKGFTGVKVITKQHGTGPHWHIQWSGQDTTGQQVADQKAEADARALQQLLETASGAKVGAASASISRIIQQAKAGTIDVTTAGGQLDEAIKNYRSATLADYDTKHPLGGLLPNEQKLISVGRAELEAKLGEEAAKFHADLYKQISDAATTAYSNAIKSLDDALEAKQRRNELPVNEASQRVSLAQSDLNKSKAGAGTLFALQRDLRIAEVTRDQGNLSALDDDLAKRKVQKGTLVDAASRAKATGGENSEAYLGVLEKIREADVSIAEQEDKILTLRGNLAARTGELAEVPLAERIRQSTAAWADQSGVMDGIGKTLENSIGPALDQLTDQFANFFTNIATGARTFQQALGDMIGAFARFVLQIIAKALALMAVKAILSAFGLQLNDGVGGVTIGKKAFNGGEVEGRFNGGPIHKLMGGGRVNHGFSTHDSARYDLAEGEYVVRNKAVKDLGIPFMEDINRHGSKALDKLGGTNIIAPPARQETNVYVVQEKSRQQMGPNDVLVVLQEDILQGGPTKKLIKQVAQGA